MKPFNIRTGNCVNRYTTALERIPLFPFYDKKEEKLPGNKKGESSVNVCPCLRVCVCVIDIAAVCFSLPYCALSPNMWVFLCVYFHKGEGTKGLGKRQHLSILKQIRRTNPQKKEE